MVINGLDTVYPGVTVNGMDISGMDKQEAAASLTDVQVAATVSMPNGDSFIVTAQDVGIDVSPEAMAELAMQQGRSGNIISNTAAYLSKSSRDIMDILKAELDPAAVKSAVEPHVDSYNTAVGGAAYEINGNKLTVLKGAGQMSTDAETISQLVMDTLSASFDAASPMESEFTLSDVKPVSIQSIYDSVFVEAANASYDAATGGIKPSVTGVHFDKTAAQTVYDAADMGDTVTIDLIFTEPEIKAEKAEDLLFRDVLYSCATYLTNYYNRNNNIRLAAAAIDGYVLKPGETFSFNDVVGERTTAKGYLEGTSYIGGKAVPDVGGGICQVSSSLYCCAVYTDLEIVDRSNHMFTVSYLPLGIDATVNWGTCDFQFKNNTDFPIKIEAYIDEEAWDLVVNFHGTKLDDIYAEVTYEIAGVHDYETKEEEDPTLKPGERKLDTSGFYGYLVYTYRSWYTGDGELIETEFLDVSDYSACDEIYLVGPKLPEGENPGENAGENQGTTTPDPAPETPSEGTETPAE